MAKKKFSVYVAYGSNMDLAQMVSRCPDAMVLGLGVIKDWRLMFKGSYSGNYATIEREVGQSVPVMLWRISTTDEARLDRYEGFPTFYYKDTVDVETVDPYGKGEGGGVIRGMVYIMHEERILGAPSRQYYNLLDDAYRRCCFDRRILKAALRYSVGDE